MTDICPTCGREKRKLAPKEELVRRYANGRLTRKEIAALVKLELSALDKYLATIRRAGYKVSIKPIHPAPVDEKAAREEYDYLTHMLKDHTYKQIAEIQGYSDCGMHGYYKRLRKLFGDPAYMLTGIKRRKRSIPEYYYQLCDMREQGLSWQQIAEAMGKRTRSMQQQYYRIRRDHGQSNP
jgi:hypothetical protein